MSLPPPAPGSPAERLERGAEANPRWDCRANLEALYATAPILEHAADGSPALRWTVDAASGREVRTTWRVDRLNDYVYLESLERGDRSGRLQRGAEPQASPCPDGCPLSAEAAPTDPVPMLAAPGSTIPAADGARVLQHASARANLFPYLPEAVLLMPLGDRHGRPATWPDEAIAETLLLAAHLETRARRSPHVRGLEIFHNLGREAFGSQDHPHLQVVPRHTALPWPRSPGLTASRIERLRAEADLLARRGRFAARLNPGTGDPWIDAEGLGGWSALSWQDCLDLGRLWKAIDRAYALADCEHLNALFHAPDFEDRELSPYVAFAPRDRGWGRGRAGFELLHHDRIWVTARPVEELAGHFRECLAE